MPILRRTSVIVLVPVLAALLIGSSPTTANPVTGIPGAGPSGPVGPTERACTGVPIALGNPVQRVIDSHPAGSTFCLAPGVHRVSAPVRPRAGDALVGLRGAVLSGSRVLTDWRPNGALWSARGTLPPQPGTHEFCLETEPSCGRTEDVFLDKQRLRRVDSVSAVVPGTVHADYPTSTITLADDPRSRLVEQAVAKSLVQSTVDDVTVANLVLEQAANDAQVGAVESRQVSPPGQGSGWRVVNNEVRLNHGVGIGFGGASTVTGNLIHHQGQLGFGVWGTGSVVSDNEVSFNGTAGYSPDWEAGGSKLWMTTGVTLARNHVHDNLGPGLWSDGGNIDTTYEYNTIIDNWGAGIQHEISYDAVIRFNEVTGNGRRHKGWKWDAGIQIQSSGGSRGIEVARNMVTGNANGITLLDSGMRDTDEDPAPHGPHLVQNVWVHDNVVTMGPGEFTGAVEDTGRPDIFTGNGNRFEANVYRLPSLDSVNFSWHDLDLDWAGWRGSGNDLTGRAEPAG